MTTVQGSEEWVKQRLGKVTASVIHKVYSDKLTATKKNLMRSLALERLSGSRMSNIKTVDMARGLAIEPLARKAYEIATQQKVSLVGFISHPDIKNAGASPDGLIGGKGFIEIKCLNIMQANEKSDLIFGSFTTVDHLRTLCGGRRGDRRLDFRP